MKRNRTLTAVLLAATLGAACAVPKLETIRWRTADISPDQRGLVIRYAIDRCRKVDHAEVIYERTQVIVTLLTTRTDARCLAIGFPKSLVVPLHEPLGDRRVADGGI